MITRGPRAFPGQRIGLLGGSFDPPHQGHLHITSWALKAAGLDRVWWLVSPGNPLKTHGPADLKRRLAACGQMTADHPKIRITDVERHFGSPYTANTLKRLRSLHPGVRFVWIMGADNLASFHHWREWEWIIATVPMLVLARPEQQLAAGLSPAARRFAHLRVPASQAGALGRRPGPGWALITGPMSDHSSTIIRRSGDW